MQTLEQSIAQRLYEEMPGAEQPPRCLDRGKLWGEVEHTREFQFCQQIAREMLALLKQ